MYSYLNSDAADPDPFSDKNKADDALEDLRRLDHGIDQGGGKKSAGGKIP